MKHTDNPYARTAARELLTADAPSVGNPEAVIAVFPTIEFEDGSARVAGETVNLRRVILVGPWEATSGEERA